MSSPSRPEAPGQMAQLIEAVDGLALAVTGIAEAVDGHGRMLARLIAAAEERMEDDRLIRTVEGLIAGLGHQQQTLDRIERGMGEFTQALRKAGG
jgi:hypothetical protein